MNNERRHFTPQESVTTLKQQLLEKTPISDLCQVRGTVRRWLTAGSFACQDYRRKEWRG